MAPHFSNSFATLSLVVAQTEIYRGTYQRISICTLCGRLAAKSRAYRQSELSGSCKKAKTVWKFATDRRYPVGWQPWIDWNRSIVWNQDSRWCSHTYCPVGSTKRLRAFSAGHKPRYRHLAYYPHVGICPLRKIIQRIILGTTVSQPALSIIWSISTISAYILTKISMKYTLWNTRR